MFATNVEPMDARVVNAIAKEFAARLNARPHRSDGGALKLRCMGGQNASDRRRHPSRILGDDLGKQANAADIRVLSVGSVQIATKAMAPEFEKATGHKLIFTIVSPDQIAKQLADDTYDMLIASVPVVAALDKSGGVRAGTRAPLSRAGIGVMVREGGPVPDVSTPDAFKKTVLAAKSIAYGDPDAAEPERRGHCPDPDQGRHPRRGQAEAARRRLGARARAWSPKAKSISRCSTRSSCRRACGSPARCPVPLQDYTFYEAAVLAKGAAPEASAAFIRHLTSPGARKSWEAARLDAYPYR